MAFIRLPDSHAYRVAVCDVVQAIGPVLDTLWPPPEPFREMRHWKALSTLECLQIRHDSEGVDCASDLHNAVIYASQEFDRLPVAHDGYIAFADLVHANKIALKVRAGIMRAAMTETAVTA